HVVRLLEEAPGTVGQVRGRGKVHRFDGTTGPGSGRPAGWLDADGGAPGGQRRRSPASTSTSSRFSGGDSGHDHRGSNAHDGWNEKLKSTTSVRPSMLPPRSALLAA